MDIRAIIKQTPIDLKDLLRIINNFRRNLNPKTKHLEVVEEKLINARGDLEKMLSILINAVKKEEVELHQKLAELLYERFQYNFTGIVNLIDREQIDSIIKTHSEKISIGELTTFKVFLETMYFDLVFLPIKKAYEIYEKKKNKEEFCYNLFMSLSSILEVKGGIRREAGKGPSTLSKSKSLLYGGVLPYSAFKKDKGDIIDKEHEETFGKDYSDLLEEDLGDNPEDDN